MSRKRFARFGGSGFTRRISSEGANRKRVNARSYLIIASVYGFGGTGTVRCLQSAGETAHQTGHEGRAVKSRAMMLIQLLGHELEHRLVKRLSQPHECESHKTDVSCYRIPREHADEKSARSGSQKSISFFIVSATRSAHTTETCAARSAG